MSKRTTPWTDAELALIERERQRWLAVGMSTEPADIAESQRVWAEWYRAVGRDPVFVWVTPGPVAAHAAMAVWGGDSIGASIDASLHASLHDSLGASLDASLGASLDASLDASIGASLDASIGASIGASLHASIGASIGASLHASIGDSIDDSLDDSLRASLDASIGDSIGDSIDASLHDSLGASLHDSPLHYKGTWWWGAHDAYWIGWYDCARRLGVEYSDADNEALDRFVRCASSALWAWPHEGGVVVCDRPETLHMEEATPGRWRLHAEGGPSMRFRDGYSLWALHGVRFVPDDGEKWIEPAAEDLDPREIMRIENVEQRAAVMRRVGIERMLAQLESRTLDTSGDGMYELLDVRLTDDVTGRYLKMRNPSVPGLYHLEGVEGDTVQHAINWRAGAILPDGEDWTPAQLT